MHASFRFLILAVTGSLAACAVAPVPAPADPDPVSALASQHHADLLSGGLGLEGLRQPAPPAFADPAAPSAEELRRRALWTNWRGIADLAPGGGFGEGYGSLAAVPGREFHALRTVPGARHPHRVMAQVPDGFDTQARCLLVTASSGSRGIYGAIALGGAWGLPRGCAVAYTDKGAGTDWVELGSAHGHALDGRLATTTEAAFVPAAAGSAPGPRVAYKHAHSQDNPEADWGRHVRQAAEFGLEALDAAFPAQAPFTFANTRVIAAGLSNGGGAVLRAAEIQGDWLDGVVAVAPNVWTGAGGRQLYDYATQAAVYMPCALLHPRFDSVALARPGGGKPPAWILRCAALAAAGLLRGDSPEAQARAAYGHLRDSGWSDAAMEAGALSVSFDLWRSLGVGYAAAYSRSSADAMPCGFGYAVLDPDGRPRAATPEQRAAWWSDASGIPPGNGVGILDPSAEGTDPAMPGLLCLRALWESGSEASLRLRAGIQATRAALPRAGLPVLVIHGADDGLVPEAFSGGVYARWARASDRRVRYWRIQNAQHFDAFLASPALATRYVPLLPYAYRALDAMWAHVAAGARLPDDAEVAAAARKPGAAGPAPLEIEDLALPAPPGIP